MTVEDEDDKPRELTKQRIDITKPMQQHILATALRVDGMMARLRPVLKPEYFDDPDVSDMLAWTNNFWDEHKQVPSKHALKDVFRDQKALIKSLFTQDLPDTEHTAERIATFARIRACRLAAIKVGDIISAEMKGEEYKNPLTNKVEEVNILDLFKQAMDVGKDMSQVGEFWDQVLEKNLAEIINPVQTDVIATGMDHLDLSGVNLERSELGCVLGASKKGKSHVLVNIAYNAMKAGRNVVYYSLEMRSFRVFKRFYGRLAGRKYDVKQDPTKFAEAVREKNKRLIKGKMLMKRFTARTASAEDLAAHLTQLKAMGFKPDLIIVDYAGLMRPRKEHKEVRHNLASIFLDLRNLAGEFNAAIWTAAQANRAAVNKPVVTMSDFAECFEIVQHLDAGFSICMTEDEKAENTGRFFVLASRNEADGAIVEFDFDYSRSLIITKGITQPIAQKKHRDKMSNDQEREEAAHQNAKDRKDKSKKKSDHDGEQP